MRRTFLASVSAAVLTSSAVMAADMPVKARPIAPAPMWSGFYVGLNAGYVWGNSDPSFIGPPPTGITGTTGAPPSLKPQGFIGGGQAGYNWQAGQWVFGGEIDFSGLDAKADASLSPFFLGKGNNRTVTWSSRYGWLFTARLRAGFLVAPNWLVYATGGLAVTHVHDSVTCQSTVSACGDFAVGTLEWSGSSTLTGGTVGGGIETMLAPNWTARVEYLYAKFKDTTPPVTTMPPFSVTVVPASFTFNHDLNIVRFAVNYKFNP